MINVVPASAEAWCILGQYFFLRLIVYRFDVRVAPSVDLDAWQRQLSVWCDVPGVRYELHRVRKNRASYRGAMLICRVQAILKHHLSTVNADDVWWKAFSGALNDVIHAARFV
jgi:hypothetical protein